MVTLLSSLKVSQQSIGVATKSSGFDDVDGILGIGPVDLTIGTLSEKSKSIPTITDSLFANKAITSNTLGIFFQPTGSKASSVFKFISFLGGGGHDVDFLFRVSLRLAASIPQRLPLPSRMYQSRSLLLQVNTGASINQSRTAVRQS
jgi:hypothetical protein